MSETDNNFISSTLSLQTLIIYPIFVAMLYFHYIFFLIFYVLCKVGEAVYILIDTNHKINILLTINFIHMGIMLQLDTFTK